ncbi:MAG TPA: alginate lyase family protein, partial [Phycisphaerae bacterium]|nr:alginate lyase family protein [Phycisphaerae bacterium]
MPARILLTKFSPIKYASVIGLAAFILFLSACSSAPPPQHPAESNIESNVKSNLALTVQDLDYEQIVSAADVYLTQTPLTITAYPPPADGGGIHEYYSQAPYFWPNPKDPNGPYVRRDGYSNPNVFNAHFKAMNEMSVAISTLTAAYMITNHAPYAQKAIEYMRAWFVDPATMMAPNLQYAQVIKGVSDGRGTGIIDTHTLVKVARSAEILEQDGVLTGADEKGVNQWFTDYLHWLT